MNGNRQQKKSNPIKTIFLLLSLIALGLQIFTYSGVLLKTFKVISKEEVQRYYMVLGIYLMTLAILLVGWSMSNKSKLFCKIGIISSWIPLMVVPFVIDLNIIKSMFPNNQIIQVISLISLSQGALSTIGYLIGIIHINKNLTDIEKKMLEQKKAKKQAKKANKKKKKAENKVNRKKKKAENKVSRKAKKETRKETKKEKKKNKKSNKEKKKVENRKKKAAKKKSKQVEKQAQKNAKKSEKTNSKKGKNKNSNARRR
ncbi:hypothetical protein CHF27_010150 [Romboutsia maritimum]|uniref:Uncharacterized protein n=1 Tax=Romboutsia maritimum TaxID=2020948 RepID=A0A371IRD5_9FIRM|nr:hypothetical protein [Romboutsia maritimum]RDY23033.1 hypothetical protein CHF27_010150 [Romboutsia maritimum]